MLAALFLLVAAVLQADATPVRCTDSRWFDLLSVTSYFSTWSAKARMDSSRDFRSEVDSFGYKISCDFSARKWPSAVDDDLEEDDYARFLRLLDACLCTNLRWDLIGWVASSYPDDISAISEQGSLHRLFVRRARSRIVSYRRALVLQATNRSLVNHFDSLVERCFVRRLLPNGEEEATPEPRQSTAAPVVSTGTADEKPRGDAVSLPPPPKDASAVPSDVQKPLPTVTTMTEAPASTTPKESTAAPEPTRSTAVPRDTSAASEEGIPAIVVTQRATGAPGEDEGDRKRPSVNHDANRKDGVMLPIAAVVALVVGALGIVLAAAVAAVAAVGAIRRRVAGYEAAVQPQGEADLTDDMPLLRTQVQSSVDATE